MSGHEKRRLDAAVLSGMAWTAGAKWVTQALTWVSVLVAARLLSPADFGIMEMAGAVTIIANVLAEFGIGAAVLQMRDLDRRVLSQLHTVSLVFSTALFIVTAAAAPVVAGFFRNEALTLLVIVNSLGFFITAAQAVPVGLLQRDMDYRRLSIAEAIQAVLQAVVTIACAFAGWGYWTFVAAALTGKGTSAALTWYWQPVRYALPRRDDIAIPMRFGLELAATRVAWTAYSHMDSIVIGRVLGESALGAYRLAVNLASAPADKVGQLLMRVTGPLFARVQDDSALLRRYFFILSDGLILVTLPLLAGLVVVAEEAVHVVLGPKWAAAVGPLQWLSAFMVLRMLQMLVSQVLTSLRMTRFQMVMSFVTFVVMPPAFYLAAGFGTTAVAAALLVTSPVTILPYYVRLFRALGWRMWDYLRVLTPAVVSTVVMTGAVWGLQRWVLPESWAVPVRLGVEVVVGGAVYAGMLLGPFRGGVLEYARVLKQLYRDRGAVKPVEVVAAD